MRQKFNVHKHTLKKQMSQWGVWWGGGGGVSFHALVKFPLVEIWSIFYYLDVPLEIYFRKSIVMTETCNFLADKKTVIAATLKFGKSVYLSWPLSSSWFRVAAHEFKMCDTRSDVVAFHKKSSKKPKLERGWERLPHRPYG